MDFGREIFCLRISKGTSIWTAGAFLYATEDRGFGGEYRCSYRIVDADFFETQNEAMAVARKFSHRYTNSWQMVEAEVVTLEVQE